MGASVRALRARPAASPVLDRYVEIARIVTGQSNAAIADGVEWAWSLCTDMEIPGLSRYGLTEAGIPAVVAGAQRASSANGNPIALSDDELSAVLRQALESRPWARQRELETGGRH